LNFLPIIIGGFLIKEYFLVNSSETSLEDESEDDLLDKVLFISILSSEVSNEKEL